MSKQKATGPDAKKAAKILSDFVSRDKSRPALLNVYHDKEAGVAVASDGRALIATRHGFDPDAKPLDVYYPWQKVIPSAKSLVNSTTVNPAELVKTCKDEIRRAKATGNKKGIVLYELRMGGKTATVDAKLLLKVAVAMAANGLTELRTGKDVGKEPIMTRNAETTIVFMPVRMPETPAPAEKETDAKSAPAAAPAKKPAEAAAPAVETAKAAENPALWNPDEWKRLTSANLSDMARVCVCTWAAANATTERDELVLMANDYAFVFNEGRAAPSQALIDFRTELDEELRARVTRVYGAAKWDAIRACL